MLARTLFRSSCFVPYHPVLSPPVVCAVLARNFSYSKRLAMPPIPPLFALQIPNLQSSAAGQSAGSFDCVQVAAGIYALSFSSPPDNRLTPAFNATFLLALDIIEHKLPQGVVITTSSITKFYSNGLDYENAIKDPTFFRDSLFPLWRRLITYPMPTLALMNGHAFAGGLMTAMFHDYRIMNPHKGYVCLNELDFGGSTTTAYGGSIPNKAGYEHFQKHGA